VIEAACLEGGAGLIRVGWDVTWEGLGFDNGRQLLNVKGRLDSYRLSLPLLGRYQMENAAVAVAALEVLVERGFSIPRSSIIGGLGQVSWPGRFQILGHNPLIVADGAHNPASARELRRSLEHYFQGCCLPEGKPFKPAVLVFGASWDKDIAGIVPELYPFFDRVIATRSHHPRSVATASVVAEFGKYGVEARITEAVPGALSLAREMAGEGGFICITGSLFVVGEAIEYLTPAV
jgi:dihydrofolate synthase/folylpolyglutamate synthase